QPGGGDDDRPAAAGRRRGASRPRPAHDRRPGRAIVTNGGPMDAEALRPPRSLLFVPGDRPDLLAKVGRWNPDIAVLDLEDAIPASAKDRARALVAEAAGAPGPGGVAVAVRVNGPATPWFDADVAALARTAVPIVVLPKLEDPAEVARLRDAF